MPIYIRPRCNTASLFPKGPGFTSNSLKLSPPTSPRFGGRESAHWVRGEVFLYLLGIAMNRYESLYSVSILCAQSN